MNVNQILAIVLVVLSAVSAGSAQLSEAGLAASTVKAIVGCSGLLATIISGIVAILTSQGSMLKSVQAMPGVEKITVNAAANQTLAKAAVDESSKVEATPAAQAAVQRTAATGA